MPSLDPALLFGLKMALCLALFLLAAAWLRRRVARIQSIKGPPPEGASASAALAHYFQADPGGVDHERRLHRQTIRILARELQHLDADHPEARAALELLGEPASPRPPAPRLEASVNLSAQAPV